jgi:ribonuclease P protein component
MSGELVADGSLDAGVAVANTAGGRGQGASLGVVTRRADFVAANRGLRVARPGFVLLARPHGLPAADGASGAGASMRFGVTVTKKIGNAVVRNRMKRRLRALARDILPAHGLAGHDHILIGREGGVEREFALMHAELLAALGRARAGKGDAPRKGPRGPAPKGKTPKAPAPKGGA